MMLRLSLLLTLGAATSAQAMLPPCSYDALMREAVHVVQGEITFAGGPDVAGTCPLTVRVMTTLRGPIVPDTVITAAVPCTNPEGMVGGTVYTDPAALMRATAVELHLTDTLDIAAYGVGIILIPKVTGQSAWISDCD